MAAGADEGHGRRAGPGEARRGGGRRKAAGGGWAGRGRTGVGAAAATREEPAAGGGSGQQGPRGSARPPHASPPRPVDSSLRPPPRSWR